MKEFHKDPDDTLDFLWEWEDWLESGDTIVSKSVTAETGITIDDSSIENSSRDVRVWVSGGSHGEDYVITCEITTASSPARIKQKSVLMIVREE